MPGLFALATHPSRRRQRMEVTALKGSTGDVHNFADRNIAERGIRYGRVAMIPTSAKAKRRPHIKLTRAHVCFGLPVICGNCARAGALDLEDLLITTMRESIASTTLHHPTNPLLRVRNESIYYKIFIDRTKPDNTVRINPAARHSEPIYGFVVLTSDMIFEDLFVCMKLLLRHERLSYAAANSHQNQPTCPSSKTKPRGG